MFDAHIHLDQFSDTQIAAIFRQPDLRGVVAVGTDWASCKRLLALQQSFPKIRCCAGFHPEQPLPPPAALDALFEWLDEHHARFAGCGEVGLPHYLQRQQPGLDVRPYVALLERFAAWSARHGLPMNLHAVYDDAETVLAVLRHYGVKKAHFHWFKASYAVLDKVLAGGYPVGVCPDILWNEKTQRVVRRFPLERLLAETDAPWPQRGFAPEDVCGQLAAVAAKVAELKSLPLAAVRRQLRDNAAAFYGRDLQAA